VDRLRGGGQDLSDGRVPRAFVLQSDAGLEATILDWGATLARLRAPDRDGRLGDVVLGFDDLAAYRGPHPYLGAIVGRFANRIAGARFALDGRVHALAANDGPHCLHGGDPGFDRAFWDVAGAGESAVELRLHSPDGDRGFPGALDALVRYRLAGRALHLEMRATTTAPTVVSLASHAYWNLEDGGASPILDHRLAIAASRWTPVDAAGIPVGTIEPVAGTPFDFATLRAIGERHAAVVPLRGGYDHNFALDAPAPGVAARLVAPRSGRSLTIRTTLPGLQLYTGSCFDGTQRYRAAYPTPRFGAVALETQHFPNAPNEPTFPSARLDPGETYEHSTVYELNVD
jgi:aldose 1-epimerase